MRNADRPTVTQYGKFTAVMIDDSPANAFWAIELASPFTLVIATCAIWSQPII